MRLDSVIGISSAPAKAAGSSDSSDASVSFSDYLKQALNEVNDLQQEASLSGQKLAAGNEEYLHNTVIAYEKASLALELAVEIRNRLVEAYQEIMRIQM
jgi:flagellar hook-basal body complex protein FliE